MSGKDYPPPGQHTITDFTVEQGHVGQSMPQQSMPRMQYVQPMPQQQYVMGGQGIPQQQYVQQVAGQQYYQPQQQMPGQPIPQYYQHMPGQPMPGPMVGQTPAPFLNTPVQPWTTGLFDCANDLENCFTTTFCPCVTFGQIAEFTDRGMTTCASAGLIYGLLLWFTGCPCIYSMMYRKRLRAAYSLPEDPCHDCLVHFFCDQCALCQEYRELKNRGFNMNLGWIANMQLKAQQEAAVGVPPPVQGMIR